MHGRPTVNNVVRYHINCSCRYDGLLFYLYFSAIKYPVLVHCVYHLEQLRKVLNAADSLVVAAHTYDDTVGIVGSPPPAWYLMSLVQSVLEFNTKLWANAARNKQKQHT